MPLDKNYVLNPIRQLISSCHGNVLMGLRLIENVEAFPNPTDEESLFMQFQFGNQAANIDLSKEAFKEWILNKGFEDVHTLVRTGLEHLFVYKTIHSELEENEALNIEERRIELERNANKFNFPTLLNRLNDILDEPIENHAHLESINDARNCFVHRTGIVGEGDINNLDINSLEIKGARFRYFFKSGDDEIPMEFGVPGPKNAALMLGKEEFTIQFELGQKIDISLKQFLDIINTFVFINADIETRL